ncbi:hypothetical protein CPB86DRAFT_768470 [Serendipita vermifera]|nr:hypothetical protein CPB86DRAFT_768470 [Serendipita vermifera]
MLTRTHSRSCTRLYTRTHVSPRASSAVGHAYRCEKDVRKTLDIVEKQQEQCNARRKLRKSPFQLDPAVIETVQRHAWNTSKFVLETSKREYTLNHPYSLTNVHQVRAYSNSYQTKRPLPKTTSTLKPKIQKMRTPDPPSRGRKPSKTMDETVVRNPVGVQLLSRPLHAQIFRNASFEPPPETSINISRDHLVTHGLNPNKASTSPNVSFTLPPLEGSTIDAHFYNIGYDLARPTKELATTLSSQEIPKPPTADVWVQQSGWTKYTPDGSSGWKVERGVGPDRESSLVFDVETMPNYHKYAIMACAASSTSWYCWISPWLLGETEEPKHLIPLGSDSNPESQRIVVGHNVAYDRARVLEEYNLTTPSNIRWIDTMALHVAVKGISSVQRPAWITWNKQRTKQAEEEGLADEEQIRESPLSEARLREDMRREMEASSEMDADESVDVESTRWEAVTSINSLLEVAKLHCGIKLNKETRNAFMTDTPAQILAELPKYLDYCAQDVHVTHAVFQKTLPLFFERCPHPVSWAGVMQMGSSILTVNQEWEKYLERAEAKYREMENTVKNKLIELAEEAKDLMESGAWKGDVFLEQLDWTPKQAGKSRGYWVPTVKQRNDMDKKLAELSSAKPTMTKRDGKRASADDHSPKWYRDLVDDPCSTHARDVIIPLLLQVKWRNKPMFYSPKHGWLYRSPNSLKLPEGDVKVKITESDPLSIFASDETCFAKPKALSTTKYAFWTKRVAGKLYSDNFINWTNKPLGESLMSSQVPKKTRDDLMKLANETVHRSLKKLPLSLQQLDWSTNAAKTTREVKANEEAPITMSPDTDKYAGFEPPDGLKYPAPCWPQWYWDLAKPRKDAPRGSIDITVRNRLAPILLRLGWMGNPLFHAKGHGWCYGVKDHPDEAQEKLANGEPSEQPKEQSPDAPTPLVFDHPEDLKWSMGSILQNYKFFKLPHAEGQEANVGNPLSKSFLKYAQDGTLKSISTIPSKMGTIVVQPTPDGSNLALVESGTDETQTALDMNAQCSYWISARDRVLKQMVVWEKQTGELGIGANSQSPEDKWGIILPQVITMGTVTRRAIEKTWLTASNAKKNRIGSELKAMVRAPPGYAIVGADVDSEELWISSVMGDAQFGMHGATAIGWMTLEGTKQHGTDLHSKTASILGITRDSAKVFNYSRIYGAGMRHAVLLLQQGNAGMSTARAKQLAEELYASTKGKNTHTLEHFGKKFWYGGTESYLFNKLEAIAHSDNPSTPALGCGVTSALSKKHLSNEFRADYLTSRINWVVQSSGVDYLHLLIASTEYLFKKYSIRGRYMISVHDELRYVVKEEDKYRAALALQIANLWTRCLFAYRLGLGDLPAGVGFFSAVDVDFVLRKEVDQPCVTPSNPNPIEPGESLDIHGILTKTRGGSLWADGRAMEGWVKRPEEPPNRTGYTSPDCSIHRAEGPEFLKAQSTRQLNEIKVDSVNWAKKLRQMGREDELKGWVRKMPPSKRGRGRDDTAMMNESFALPEGWSKEDLEETL